MPNNSTHNLMKEQANAKLNFFGSDIMLQQIAKRLNEGLKDEVKSLLDPIVNATCGYYCHCYHLNRADQEDVTQDIWTNLFAGQLDSFIANPCNNSFSSDIDCLLFMLKEQKYVNSSDFSMEFIQKELKQLIDDNEYPELTAWLNTDFPPYKRPLPGVKAAHALNDLAARYRGSFWGSASEKKQAALKKLELWLASHAMRPAVYPCIEQFADSQTNLTADQSALLRLWLDLPCAQFPRECIPALEEALNTSKFIPDDTPGLHFAPREKSAWLKRMIHTEVRHLAEKRFRSKNDLSLNPTDSRDEEGGVILRTDPEEEPRITERNAHPIVVQELFLPLLSLPFLKGSKVHPKTVINIAYLFLRMLHAEQTNRKKPTSETICTELKPLTVSQTRKTILQLFVQTGYYTPEIIKQTDACFDELQQGGKSNTPLQPADKMNEDLNAGKIDNGKNRIVAHLSNSSNIISILRE